MLQKFGFVERFGQMRHHRPAGGGSGSEEFWPTRVRGMGGYTHPNTVRVRCPASKQLMHAIDCG
jgi:hypothetical protein